MTEEEMLRELDSVRRMLEQSGLHAALGYLNGRTSYRFTGIYRYDGDTLRNVALFDRWTPHEPKGADAPMRETFCAIVRDSGEWLEVENGHEDERFPWMQQNDVVCYSGALIRDPQGGAFGTLCHFDVQRCQPAASEIALLQAAGPCMYDYIRQPA